ncbi:MAG: hypothetical protein ISS47_03075 [Candidatus Omnitrophica bacterium]|nr:hypothetical protein [Candidatus Omnitrophota bacterium]
MKTSSHINGFKNKQAFTAFMQEAMALETNICRNINHNHCEMLYLFVNDATGHIITWYRENDPAAIILDAQYYNLYHKIPWQIQGTA